MQLGKEREIVGFQLRLVVLDARPGKLLQVGGQRLEETELVQRQLGFVAHAGREGEANTGIEINLDRDVRTRLAEGAVVVEAVVMKERRAALDVMVGRHPRA